MVKHSSQSGWHMLLGEDRHAGIAWPVTIKVHSSVAYRQVVCLSICLCGCLFVCVCVCVCVVLVVVFFWWVIAC